MSRLDTLIAEHCPEGVEFARLGELVRIRNGKDYKALGSGEIPVYGTGGIMLHVDTAAHPGPSVLIPRKGSLDKLYYVDKPFWTVDTIFYTEIGDRLVPKFLYYHLSTQRLEKLNQAGGVPSLTQSVLNLLLVPVPPLNVQREIVRVLDQFTQLEAELIAELKAELESRRRQYEYYRDSLMTSPSGGCARISLGELGKFIRGRRFTKADVVAEGIPSIHYGEIYTHFGVATLSTISHVRESLADQLRFAAPGDVVIAAVGETVEDVGKAVAWLGDKPVAIHDDTFLFRSELNPKFVSYFLQTADFHMQKNKYVARAKVKRLSGESLAKILISVPSLSEQERTVALLDRLDAAVNDLSLRISTELASRRQQYEHYRGRLLTFQEAVA